MAVTEVIVNDNVIHWIFRPSSEAGHQQLTLEELGWRTLRLLLHLCLLPATIHILPISLVRIFEKCLQFNNDLCSCQRAVCYFTLFRTELHKHI